MKLYQTQAGFHRISHTMFTCVDGEKDLIRESSAVKEPGDTPGTCFLWVGADHHLGRKEVRELWLALARWLDTGTLAEGVK